MNKKCLFILATMLISFWSSSQAALSVNRSRFIFDENEKTVSVLVTNTDKLTPYLAQGWLEDENDKKVPGPMMVLPPLQRMEPGEKTIVRIMALPDVDKLPKDRESVFYFNMREIPPKSEKNNVLTLAMQTRLKIFWRPESIKVDPSATNIPGIKNITLKKTIEGYIISNPTPYHITFVDVLNDVKTGKDKMKPLMVKPKCTALLPFNNDMKTMGLVFVNDFGTKQVLNFECNEGVCAAKSILPSKN